MSKELRAAYVLDSSGVARGRAQAEKEMAGLDASAKKMSDSFDAHTSRMGGSLSRLSGTLGGFGLPFSEALSKIGERFDEASAEGASKFDRLSEVGRTALLGISGAAVAVGAESVHMAASYEQATADMAAKADIPIQQADKIGQAFLNTAGKVTFSAQEIEAAYGPVAGQLAEVAGHALDAKQAMTVMSAATSLAEASGQDLNTSTASLASTMQAYHLGVGDAAKASDVLFNTSRKTGNTVDAVAQAAARLKMRLGDATPPIGEIGGLMVELADHGVVGSRSVNMVGSALAQLVYPSTTAQKALDAMGVKLTDAHGQFIGLGPAMDALREGLSKLPGGSEAAAAAQQLAADKTNLARLAAEKQTPAIKDQEKAIKAHDLALKAQAATLSSSAAAQQLFGANASTLIPIILSGSQALQKQTEEVGKAGSAHEAAEKQASTLKGQEEKLKASVEDLGTKFGMYLIPKLEDVIDKTEQVISWFGQHKDAAYALAAVVGGTLSVAIGAFTVNKVAGMIDGVSKAAKSMSDFAGKVADVAGKVTGHFGDIQSGADKMSTGVSSSASKMENDVGSDAESMATRAKNAASGMENGVTRSASSMEQQASASTAGMRDAVTRDAQTMATTTEGTVTGMSASVDTEVGGMASTVDGEIAGMAVTADTEAAGMATAVEGDMAEMDAAQASMFGGKGLLAGLAAFTAADIGSNYLPGAHNAPSSVTGFENVTKNIPILGDLGNNIGNSILNGLGYGGGGPGTNTTAYTPGIGYQDTIPLGPGGQLPGFAAGGIVPGPAGRPLLAIVHGGETVIPPEALSRAASSAPGLDLKSTHNGGGVSTINLHVTVSGLVTGTPQQVAEALAPTLRQELMRLSQTSGTSGLTL